MKAFHELTVSSRAHPLTTLWDTTWAAGRCLLPRGLPQTGGQPTSPWSSPQAAGESLLSHLEHLLPIGHLWPWCLQSYSFSHAFFLTPHCLYSVIPILEYTFPEVSTFLSPGPRSTCSVSAEESWNQHGWGNPSLNFILPYVYRFACTFFTVTIIKIVSIKRVQATFLNHHLLTFSLKSIITFLEFLAIQLLILSVPHIVTALRKIVLFTSSWLILPFS